jgi:mono/diheme cytochrome c family protein
MINSKTILILTLSLLASLVLAGCGTQSAPEPAPTKASQSAEPQVAPTDMAESAPTEAPAEAPAQAAGATVSFANDVQPIIESRCINCHGGERVEKGLNLSSYADLMAGSENGPVVVPGDPANSKLVELVDNQKMPKRGPNLTPPQVQIISDWVAAGALNN